MNAKHGFPMVAKVVTLCFFAAAAMASIPAAAMMLEMDIEQLTKGSSSVVVGKVTDSQSMWKGDEIVTVVTLQIDEVVKGKVGKKTIAVEYLGGQIGDVELVVSDVRIPIFGEDLLLFLLPARDNRFSVFGKAQGQFSLDTKRGVAERGGYLLMKDADRHPVKTYRLEQLIRLIKRASRSE